MRNQLVREIGTLRRFLLVGAATTALDFGIFNTIVTISSLPLAAANTISYSCGIGLSLLLHRNWTFSGRNRGNSARREALKFIAWNLTGLVISGALVQLGAMMLSATAAKLCSIAAMTILNFTVSRFWVFGPVRTNGFPNTKPHLMTNPYFKRL